MARTRVSSKYQVVIPKEVRREIGLESGQDLEIVAKNGIIALIPDRPLSQLRGFVKGLKTDKIRDKKERM